MIQVPTPESFFVIRAMNEHSKDVFLQRPESIYSDFWTSEINDFTYRFYSRKEAKTIMDIQIDQFPERNRNLSAFKIKQIKPVLTIR